MPIGASCQPHSHRPASPGGRWLVAVLGPPPRRHFLIGCAYFQINPTARASERRRCVDKCPDVARRWRCWRLGSSPGVAGVPPATACLLSKQPVSQGKFKWIRSTSNFFFFFKRRQILSKESVPRSVVFPSWCRELWDFGACIPSASGTALKVGVAGPRTG